MILESSNIKLMKFPGGELHVQVLNIWELEQQIENDDGYYPIVCHFNNNDDLMYIALIADAIRSVVPKVKLALNMPYFPYGRQDRNTAIGSPFSLRIVADFINSIGFEWVDIADPHSNVTQLLVKNAKVYNPAESLSWLAQRKRKNFEDCIVVAPDAGAVKRTEAVANKLGLPFAIAHKHRDPKTGQITSTNVYGDIPEGSNFLIFDDICDGGRTFTELAKVLKEKHKSKEIDLYVTFGIYSKGMDVFSDFQNVEAVYKFWENK